MNFTILSFLGIRRFSPLVWAGVAADTARSGYIVLLFSSRVGRFRGGLNIGAVWDGLSLGLNPPGEDRCMNFASSKSRNRSVFWGV